MNQVPAVVSYLLGLPAITALCNTRVYGTEIPDEIAGQVDTFQMPPRMIVVNAVPSAQAARQKLAVGWTLNDLRCYGPTQEAAIGVWNVAYRALKMMPDRVEAAGTRLYSASPYGGANAREPETNWPLCFGQFELLAAEVS